MKYIADGTPSVVFGGEEYGTGSSRDWAAKGTQLLGVKAVIARSFERIHRANLVGMGVLPLQFLGADSAQSLGIKGDETIDILGLAGIQPQQELKVQITRATAARWKITVKCRIDTAIEVDYYRHGGILPFVLRELIGAAATARKRGAQRRILGPAADLMGPVPELAFARVSGSWAEPRRAADGRSRSCSSCAAGRRPSRSSDRRRRWTRPRGRRRPPAERRTAAR